MIATAVQSLVEWLQDTWMAIQDAWAIERNRFMPSRRVAHLCQGCGETSYPLIDFWAMTLHCSVCERELVWWATA